MKLATPSVRIWLAVALCALAASLWSACAGAPRPQGDGAAGSGGGGATSATTTTPRPAGPATWHDVMEDVVAPAYEIVLLGEAKLLPEQMDLTKVARAAREAAAVMQLGYGALERKDVPGFADMARSTEQWLRQIAADADAGRAAQVRTAIVDGEVQHCIACHDAVERRGR